MASEPIADLADRLDALAETLTTRERAILHAMVRATMAPLDRAAHRPVGEVLSAEEQGLVDEIDRRGE